jgi:transposase
VHYAGKTNLIVIRQTPNAQRYCDGILRPVVAPFMRRNNRCIFEQDYTRPHIAPLSSNVLLAKNVNTLPWPSRSPDLAPIEHIWDMLNRQIRENHHPFNSLQELENALIIEWNAIPQYKIQTSSEDVEIQLLPTGPGQDTDIVDFCVNSSGVTYCIP